MVGNETSRLARRVAERNILPIPAAELIINTATGDEGEIRLISQDRPYIRIATNGPSEVERRTFWVTRAGDQLIKQAAKTVDGVSLGRRYRQPSSPSPRRGNRPYMTGVEGQSAAIDEFTANLERVENLISGEAKPQTLRERIFMGRVHLIAQFTPRSRS